MKRRFRELARAVLPEAGIAGADHVLIGRAGGIERPFAELRERRSKRALGEARREAPDQPRSARDREWSPGSSSCSPAAGSSGRRGSCRRAAATSPSCSAYAITALSRYGAAARELARRQAPAPLPPLGGFRLRSCALKFHQRPYDEASDVNENKNMILAIVLSALVLLGWGLVTRIFFPTANPPVDQGREGRGQVPVAAAQARSPPPIRRAAIRDLPDRARRDAARADRDAAPGGLDQPQGRAHRRPRPHRPQRRPSPAIRRRCGCSRRPARATPISAASAGPARAASVPGAGHRLAGRAATRLTPATPVTLSWNNGQGQTFQIRLSIDDELSDRGPADASPIAAQGAVAVRPYAFVSRIGPSRDPDTWTDACRADGRVQRRRQLRQRL